MVVMIIICVVVVYAIGFGYAVEICDSNTTKLWLAFTTLCFPIIILINIGQKIYKIINN